MRILKMGNWYIRSASDPHWNKTGRTMVGFEPIPYEALAEKERLMRLYGIPPADLEMGYTFDPPLGYTCRS